MTEARSGSGTGGRSRKPVASQVSARQAGRVSPARAAAAELLERIERTSVHSDDVLHGPRLAGLSQADRDLTTALVLGVLRWQISLDARIAAFLSRPDAAVAEPVKIALRLGAFQLLHMDLIPAHAALNESVELVRSAGHPHAAGMVNAILRKLVGAGPSRKPLVESSAALAQRLGHPAWLVERWVDRYGRAAAEAICTFDQSEPACTNMFTATADQREPVMDAGSRLVAELAAVVAPTAARVWDCCAAPGGKTLVLARRLPEAEMLATDASSVRLRRLIQRFGRELPGRQVSFKEADAAQLPDTEGAFDLILCDVPCSGTGTLARNPEIRHRLWAEDLLRQAERQRRILDGALHRLTTGGRLIYSTCSLEPEECEGIVEAVLANREAGFRLVAMPQALDSLQQAGVLQVAPEQWQAWVRGPYLRTLPGVQFDGDGFFATVIERI